MAQTKPVGGAVMLTADIPIADPANPKQLNPELVERYSLVNAEYSRAERERAALREKILAGMREQGLPCPTCKPWLLRLTIQQRSVNGWKEICAAIIDMLGERLQKKAVAIIATMQAEKVDVAQVTVIANPDWRRSQTSQVGRPHRPGQMAASD